MNPAHPSTEREQQLPPPQRVGAFVKTQLDGFRERLAAATERVLSSSDGEAVHDLRVALRRTRTALQLGRDVLGRFRADVVRR
jgi:CHAD domain-containing protein